jgi:glucose uptake protein
MYQPEAYGIALLFMIISMLFWGSWANTMKLTAGYAFQLYYWDYVIGIVLGSLGWGFTLGNWGGGDLSFLSNISQADSRHILFAIAGGAVFNVANLLLGAAIDIAGLAVAFPIGIGLALVVGVLLNYAIAPKGHPGLLFGGMALVVLAIILDALAYRRRESERRSISVRGIWISVACGVLMGIFYPLVTKAVTGENSLGPYSVALFFALGVVLCAIPVNYLFMKKPLTGTPPGQHVSILRGESGMALLGRRRWTHLVYRNRFQLRGIPRTNNRSGGLICNWPRCHYGIGRLGRLCLERIRQRSAGLSQNASRYVHLLPAWAGIDRDRTQGESLARIGFHAETSRRRWQHQSRLGRGS